MGGHVSTKGYQNDCEKYTAATVLGWRVLRFTTNDMTKSPTESIKMILGILDQGPVREGETQTQLFGLGQ
jgi:very-short-patch-repair endonuclease